VPLIQLLSRKKNHQIAVPQPARSSSEAIHLCTSQPGALTYNRDSAKIAPLHWCGESTELQRRFHITGSITRILQAQSVNGRIHMSVRIYFSNGSIRNTTLSCDSLGIHYTVSKTGGVISLARWDSETNSNITVGEIEFRLLEKHRIRVGQDGEWQLMKDFLSKDEETVMSR
jgi:hypothetical protein